jgi:hypothetical protein
MISRKEPGQASISESSPYWKELKVHGQIPQDDHPKAFLITLPFDTLLFFKS